MVPGLFQEFRSGNQCCEVDALLGRPEIVDDRQITHLICVRPELAD